MWYFKIFRYLKTNSLADITQLLYTAHSAGHRLAEMNNIPPHQASYWEMGYKVILELPMCLILFRRLERYIGFSNNWGSSLPQHSLHSTEHTANGLGRRAVSLWGKEQCPWTQGSSAVTSLHMRVSPLSLCGNWGSRHQHKTCWFSDSCSCC